MMLSSVVIDTDDVAMLSNFYQNLLGWEKKVYDHGEDGLWVTLRNKKESTTRLVFQEIENYQRPVWPEEKGTQQQMMHLDFYVDDLEESVKHALNCGAVLAPYQSGDWKVLIIHQDTRFALFQKEKGSLKKTNLIC